MSQENLSEDIPETNDLDDPSDTAPRRSFRLRAFVFFAMLVLAVIAMGITMSRDQAGWELWAGLLFVYGGVSLFWSWQKAHSSGKPIWGLISAQILHWSAVFVSFVLLLVFERSDIISREAASDMALLLLALACFLAGVHFEWTFMLLGVVLAVMVVSLSYLEQYIVWLIMIPIIAGAVWIFIRRRFHIS